MCKNLLLALWAAGLAISATAFAVQDQPLYENSSRQKAQKQRSDRLRISFRNAQFEAHLHDNPTTRKFLTRLPMTISMDDIGNKEKYASLAGGLPVDGPLINHNVPGQLVYWPTGPGIAIYYKTDGKPVRGGIVVMAEIETGIEKLQTADSSAITFELIKN